MSVKKIAFFHTKFPALVLKNEGVDGVEGVEMGAVEICKALVFDRSSFL
jgi:hypothetical protein